MFYYVRGQLALLEAGFAVIDCGGVGYKLTISGRTRDRLAALNEEKKSDCTLFTHLSVREDGVELFGFSDRDELEAFRLLIGVSGIGPKAAVSILSAMSPSQLAAAIASDDRKTIGRAPGIGPKTAARIVLELKDKLGMLPGESDGGPEPGLASAEQPRPDAGTFSAAVDALLVLGFTRADAAAALRGIDTKALPLEDVVREALKKLMR